MCLVDITSEVLVYNGMCQDEYNYQKYNQENYI